MRTCSKFTVTGFVILCLLGGVVCAEEPAPPPGQNGEVAEKIKDSASFLRLRRDDRGAAAALETAIVRYTFATGEEDVAVDLIGAVHIADRRYYEDLNREFQSYDAVLYELVAPEGTRIPQGGPQEENRHPVAQLQGGMKELLALEHQLAVIDYTRENMVHADMSPEEFAQSMKDRGESFFQLLLKMTLDGMAQQQQQPAASEGTGLVDLALSLVSKKKATQVQESFGRQWRNLLSGRGLEINEENAGQLADLETLLALFSDNRATRLKRVMAEQMAALGGSLSSLDGPEGSTILTERNKKALESLRRELGGGKKRIAIFYGAAHLPDMEMRLLKDFGLKRGETRWVSAWDLAEK